MEIVLYPHPVLRFKSRDVQVIDEDLRRVVGEMFQLMYAAKGVGLAANQVGIPLRFFIMNPSGDAAHPEQQQVLINPRVRKRSGAEIGEEGCLSLPGLHGDVVRDEKVTIEAFDLEGQEVRLELVDLPARIFQHEYDHLDGILFIDRIEEEDELEMVRDLRKFEDKFAEQQRAGEIPASVDIEKSLKSFASSGRLANFGLA
ncbi:MAG: peptide deformylase [Planctomycetaceae bacterium]